MTKTKRMIPDEEVPSSDPSIRETVKCLLETLDIAGMKGTVKFHIYHKGGKDITVDLDATMCIPRSAFLQKVEGKKEG